MNRLVRMQFGSHLYGTNTPQSDFDYKSVFIPAARDILLQQTKDVIAVQRAKSEGEKNFAGEHDEESYALHRFMRLVGEGQTVSLDMLFTPATMWLEASPMWSQLIDNRHKLLTKKSASFVGYCRTQANKYGIRGSRVAAAKAAMEFFETAVRIYGTTAKIQEMHPSQPDAFAALHEHCQIVELPAHANTGTMLKHFECCNKKVPYTVTIKTAYEMYKRIYDEYGHRARKAAANEGIDWKALSHAVRVADEAIELLQTGHITFPLINRQHILDIKLGKLSYDAVAEEIENGLIKIEEIAPNSTLPDTPDLEWMDNFVVEQYGLEVRADRPWVKHD